ncbi:MULTISPECIES: ABC transporter permease [Clostridia]|uniref:Sugar ABC transporter permease n=1 Tax=Lacrimispora celerecrescens TaxID=29354 RepID=A0A084JPF5_9FIRM|nr:MULTISPECIES: ABC transporter permease subunit [Clostridia]KEZ90839.1 sugar ABC transporter permease [Lacrimispora celerecrescens]MSS08267.1 sugar ABC transporter permease [Clostridium sp. WB02_MRS01]CUX65106.1 putative multiple-sugar transport system permease YteP [Clostridium sp. C105KSO15]
MNKEKSSFRYRAAKDWKRNRSLYLLVLPVLIFYIMFHYKPMYGAIIAFKDYTPRLGVNGSPWVGLENFNRFFKSIYFVRLIKNTILLSLYNLIFGFPAPIILALLLNEVRSKKFKSVAQTITYLPHFISLIVVTGMLTNFAMTSGLFNDIIVMLGGSRSALLQNPKLYRTIYVASSVWQEIGWSSIIYLSALAGVDSQLYEAAQIDGAGKWKQLLNVTMPAIAPTIIIMLILKIGGLMNMGYEKTILLYNPATYDTADIISSYVYRVGLLEQDWSYSTAIGLFNSVINFGLLIFANRLSKRYSETSLW